MGPKLRHAKNPPRTREAWAYRQGRAELGHVALSIYKMRRVKGTEEEKRSVPVEKESMGTRGGEEEWDRRRLSGRRMRMESEK